MAHFHTTIEIQAPPDRVWAAMSDIEHWAESSRATLSVDFSGPLGPLAARLIRRLNARYLDLEARGLKKHAEAESR